MAISFQRIWAYVFFLSCSLIHIILAVVTTIKASTENIVIIQPIVMRHLVLSFKWNNNLFL